MAERDEDKNTKPTVLITGCSDGGLGSALALAFHDAGFHVYATARDGAKMGQLYAVAAARPGLETLPLDVQSAASIAGCAARVPRLDVLVNNAGAMMTMPVADVSIPQAKALFDTNVWGVLAVTQAGGATETETAAAAGVGGVVVVNTSVASTVPVPFYGVYGASKAAMAMLCDTMRLELEAFGVHVVELKTGAVGPTNLITNNTSLFPAGGGGTVAEKNGGSVTGPRGGGGSSSSNALILPEKDMVEGIMRRGYDGEWMAPAEWARAVVRDLDRGKAAPPARIWRGKSALLGWLVQFLPSALVGGLGEAGDEIHAGRGGAEAGAYLPVQRC
ncbi:NAD(P)-binding protein [Apiospora kogelbergensis]|uniref:NAD(P)-binding protein n=1 Tax=Apiospora kogelbergensis TaxID=1337665 RepID=A0AAW0Q6Y8_9PEZI